jgi:catechol 2,3-dioxygenase-like lactoylglutathione lyase family enzyme
MSAHDVEVSKALLTAFGRTTLLVRDQDEALAFYRDKLGFEVLYDSRTSNGFRSLHIGLPGQLHEPKVGLWLIPASGDEELARVGRQTGREPMLVVYTDDCRRAAATLVDRGVKFRIPPTADSDAVFAHFHDLYGNELVLVELPTNPRADNGER